MKNTLMVAALAMSSFAFAAAPAAAAPAAAKKEAAPVVAADPKAPAQAFLDKFNDSMVKGDAKGAAAMFAEDGSMMSPGGVWGKGRDGAEKVIADDLNGMLKGAKMKLTVENVRALGPDNLWVEGTHDVTGVKGPDGKDGMKVHLVAALTQKNGQWWISELRPYMTMPPPAAAAAPAPAPAPAKKK